MSSGDSASGKAAKPLAEAIRADIIKGVLAPGQKLRVKEIGERYGAGAIPVREALSRLASSGFVESKEQRGFWVSEISARELKDITETRILIELEALRRSMSNGAIEWEGEVIAASHRVSRTEVYLTGTEQLNPGWETAHAAFHYALLSACDSDWLLKLAGLLRDQTQRYRNLSLAALSTAASADGKPAVRDIAGEHDELVRAVLSRDIDQASTLLGRHIRLTSELVLALYQRVL